MGNLTAFQWVSDMHTNKTLECWNLVPCAMMFQPSLLPEKANHHGPN